MSRDVRELILDRLTEIARVRGFGTVARNQDVFSDGTAMPICAIFDGEEETTDDTRGRPSLRQRVVQMQVPIRVLMQAEADRLGTEINKLRLRLLLAIMSDTELDSLTLDDRGIAYLGCRLTVKTGRATEGDLDMRFSFRYMLNPADL
jgi:hypothetical protein